MVASRPWSAPPVPARSTSGSLLTDAGASAASRSPQVPKMSRSTPSGCPITVLVTANIVRIAASAINTATASAHARATTTPTTTNGIAPSSARHRSLIGSAQRVAATGTASRSSARSRPGADAGAATIGEGPSVESSPTTVHVLSVADS